MQLAVCRARSRGHGVVLLCTLPERCLAWTWSFLSLCSAWSSHSSVQEVILLCCEHSLSLLSLQIEVIFTQPWLVLDDCLHCLRDQNSSMGVVAVSGRFVWGVGADLFHLL